MSRALIVKGADFRSNAVAKVDDNLPFDARVEYIQSDGTAYIDTGIKASDNLQFEIKINIPAEKVVPFGAQNSSSVRLSLIVNNSSNQFNWRWGTQIVNGTHSETALSGDLVISNLASENVCSVNQYSATAQDNTFAIDYNLFLFGRNSSGTNGEIPTGMKLIHAKFYNAGVLVRDYIPVRDGQVGYLYDRVTKTLFGNAAQSGAFVVGSDK